MDIEKIIAALPSLGLEERQRLQANAERLIQKDGPASSQAREVLAALFDLVEAEEQERQQKVAENPPVDRIVAAFSVMPPKKHERMIIRALAASPGATSAHLTRACGYDGESAWHLHFGIMCRDRRQHLSPAPISEVRNAEFWSGILADYDAENSGFTLRSEAREAFVTLAVIS